MANAQRLNLSDKDRRYLEYLLSIQDISRRIINRANILLLKANGETIDAISLKLGINRNSVILCLKKYREGGIEKALCNETRVRSRSGVSAAEKEWILSIAYREPNSLGYTESKWDSSMLTEYIHCYAKKAGYPRLAALPGSHLKEITEGILSQYEDKNKYRYPFSPNAHAIMVFFLSFDKNTIHAANPDLEPLTSSGSCMQKEDSDPYLLIGMDLHTGYIIHKMSTGNREELFSGFQTAIDRSFPQKEKVRLILAEQSQCILPFIKKYFLVRPERYEFIPNPGNHALLHLAEVTISKLLYLLLLRIQPDTDSAPVPKIQDYLSRLNMIGTLDQQASITIKKAGEDYEI